MNDQPLDASGEANCAGIGRKQSGKRENTKVRKTRNEICGPARNCRFLWALPLFKKSKSRQGSKAAYSLSGWIGSTPEGRRPRIRGFPTGGSLAVASSYPSHQLLRSAKMLSSTMPQFAELHDRFAGSFIVVHLRLTATGSCRCNAAPRCSR